MDAYYYQFQETGIEIIDKILSAVACAGKSSHRTSEWNDYATASYDGHDGNSPVEWIQNAANAAAREFKKKIGLNLENIHIGDRVKIYNRSSNIAYKSGVYEMEVIDEGEKSIAVKSFGKWWFYRDNGESYSGNARIIS